MARALKSVAGSFCLALQEGRSLGSQSCLEFRLGLRGLQTAGSGYGR